MKRILFVAVLALFAFAPNAQATHIMGGNITYTNLGYDSIAGMYNYEIRLNMYRDCFSIIPFSIIQPIWIYEQDTANPNADKNLALSHNMFLTSTQPVNPPNQNDSCEFISNICVEEGIYIDTIQLAASPGGYHVIADICCRDNNILNINNPGTTGINYYTFIPPTNIDNTAPQFPTIPVPYLCAGDTTNYSNTAFDPDGDSLVYSFVVPNAGTAIGASPPTPNPYPWPISLVAYNSPTYSLADPFGTGGIATIDPQTGVSVYLVPNPGDYVVAVEILEYRNGQLIGVTRRDLQIIAISCSNNPAPQLDASVSTSHTITAGDTLCFDITWNDANNDSLFLTSTGDVFDILLTNPPAFLADTIGEISITSEFCWYTTCDQDRATPYQFNVSVSDDGCPAKVTNEVFTIQVNPFDASPLNGPDTLCENQSTGIGYDVAAVPGGTYQWTITNGVIASGDSTEAITVDFTATGNANVSVIVTNANGCKDTLSKDVFIKPNPTTDAGADQQFCSEDTVPIGSASIPGYTYSWAPATGLSDPSVSDPDLTLTNATTQNDTVQYIITATFDGCSNTDTVEFVVYPLPASAAGPDIRMCSGDTVSLGAANIAGYTYSWNPVTGLDDPTLSDPSLTLTNPDTIPDTVYYVVTTTSPDGCNSTDTVEVIVGPAINANAGADQLFCSDDTLQIGVTPITGYSYSWMPTTGIDDPNISNPNITLTNGTGVYDTSQIVLFVSAFGCVSSDTADMVVKPLPIADAGADQQLCTGDTIQIGTPALPGYTYAWTPGTGLNDSTIAEPLLTLSSASPTPVTFTYVVETSFDGCINTDSVDITINPLPIVTAIASPDTICANQSSTLTGSGANTYVWEELLNPGIPIDSVASTIVNPTITTTYIVIGTISSSCVLTDTVTVAVNPLPSVSASIDKDTICAGDTITLIASGTLSYDWTDLGAGGSVGTTDTLVIVPSASTDYVLTGTDANGCENYDTVSVEVISLPLANAGSDATICSSDTIFLGDTSVAGNTYLWTPSSDLNATNVSDPYAVILNAGPGADTIIYTLLVTDFFGCTSTDDVQVITETLPNVSVTSSVSVICPDSNAVLTASGAVSYYWYDNSAPTIVLDSVNPYTVTPSANTTYLVVGTSAAGCTNIDTITVNVNIAPSITATVVDDTICGGDTTTLFAAGGATYIWEDISNPSINISTSDTLNISPSSTTTYVLFGYDVDGCPNFDTITVNVVPGPIITSISGITSTCPGATGLTYTASPTNPSSTYSWDIFNGTIDLGAGTDAVSVTWDSLGVAYVNVVEVTIGGCISDTVQLDVTIALALTPSRPNGDRVACANAATGMVYTNASNPNSTYTWHALNGTIVGSANLDSVVIDWVSTGPATGYVWYEELTITTDTTCYGISDTLEVTLHASPTISMINGPSEMCVFDTAAFDVINSTGSHYNWIINGGTQISGDTTNSITATWVADGNYNVQVIETNKYGCVSDTVTLMFNVNPLPIVSAGSDRSFCIGDSANLIANGGQNYSWLPVNGLSDPTISNPVAAPGVTTNYIVTVTDSNTCVNYDSVLVTVNPLPIANAGLDDAICLNSSTALNASGGTIYSWSPTTGLDDPTSATPNANPSATTTYTVLVTDGNSCSSEDSVTITVNPLPTAVATGNQNLCAGTTVTITASGGNNYSWTPTTGLTAPSSASTGAAPMVSITYTVTVSDANGCTDTDAVTLDVTPSPVASYTLDMIVDCKGANATFNNTSVDGISYSWNFGDGNTSTDVNPTHFYSFNNNYTITLIANNGICSDTITVNENILDFSSYVAQLPNVFTPNGDNLNDKFEFGNADFAACSEIIIFNRWGKKVFESNGGTMAWDGKSIESGNDVEEGTYFYVLIVNGIEKKGSVYLTR